MPRYFFHLYDGNEVLDLVGSEMPDIASAQRHAAHYASRRLSDDPTALWHRGEWTIDVEDDVGLRLLSLRFLATTAPTAHLMDASEPVFRGLGPRPGRTV